jgi:nitrate reductase (cytochrome), electron transfer subunit
MNARTIAFAGAAAVAACAFVLTACGRDDGKVPVPGVPGAVKTSASARAERRLFDGAPPVIPHQDFGASCLSCHQDGLSVPGIGYAPMVPHDDVLPPGAMSRCVMCHVHAATGGTFVENGFVGLAQDLRRGKRLDEQAPPVIPHQILLRENCQACHTGPAAREEIRCPHPERQRCTQCHVEQKVGGEFGR